MNKIALTFDDGYISHFDIVRPLLKKYHLTGTFYIGSHGLEHQNKELFMTFDQLRLLQDDNFELGNHLYYHCPINDHFHPAEENIGLLEEVFEENNLKKPISLSYPGFHVTDEGMEVVQKAGYRSARAGCEKTLPFLDFQEGGGGPHFNCLEDDPYNINCSGIFGKNYGFTEFKASLSEINENQIPVFCFHSFKDMGISNNIDIEIDEFTSCIKFLVKHSFETIKMADLPINH